MLLEITVFDSVVEYKKMCYSITRNIVGIPFLLVCNKSNKLID